MATTKKQLPVKKAVKHISKGAIGIHNGERFVKLELDDESKRALAVQWGLIQEEPKLQAIQNTEKVPTELERQLHRHCISNDTLHRHAHRLDVLSCKLRGAKPPDEEELNKIATDGLVSAFANANSFQEDSVAFIGKLLDELEEAI